MEKIDKLVINGSVQLLTKVENGLKSVDPKGVHNLREAFTHVVAVCMHAFINSFRVHTTEFFFCKISDSQQRFLSSVTYTTSVKCLGFKITLSPHLS